MILEIWLILIIYAYYKWYGQKEKGLPEVPNKLKRLVENLQISENPFNNMDTYKSVFIIYYGVV